MNRQYQLMLNEAQVDALLQALEVYARLGCGQFEEIARLFCCDPRSRQSNALSVEHCLDQAKHSLLALQRRASYSICSYDVPVSYRLAWDMYQVIRHHVSWEAHPEGGNTVNFNEPMNVSEIPFCTIETVVGVETSDSHEDEVECT